MNKQLSPLGDIDRDRALALLAQQLELRRLDDLGADRIHYFDDGDDQFDVRRYWAMLMRRKWTILLAVVVAMLVALVYTYNTTPIYRSGVLLQIEPQGDRFLEYQGSGSLGEPDWDWYYYKTQVELLKSNSLARRVIDQLGLEARITADQAPVSGEQAQEAPGGSFFAELKSTVKALLKGARDEAGTEEASASSQHEGPNLEGMLLARLNVVQVPDSRLIRINYDSPNPREAAAVANAIADNFVNMTLERRYDATGYAKEFLEDRIAQVRAALEDSERRLVEYAKEREIVDFDDKLGNLQQTLNALNGALVAAQTKRIESQAEYTQAQKGAAASTLKVLESEAIEALKMRKRELELTYQDNLKIYKPGYSKMQQLRRQIEEVDRQIQQEIAAIEERVVFAVKAELAANVDEEAALQVRVREVKSDILDLQNRSTDYQALQREVMTNRELYDGLLQRMKEVGVVAGLTTNNISIVDRAKIPTAPYKPNLRSNLTKAIVIGLAAGILLVFLFEYLDDTVKTADDVESRGRIPVLGTLPMASTKHHGIREDEIALLAATQPKTPLAEAARSLRTSLTFATTEGAPAILHVTSAGAGEGKTTVATNLAIAFAQSGHKVLIIDADLRSPSIHHVFSQANTAGLSNYLAGDMHPAEISRPTQVARLFTITSGPLPPNPVELLSSDKMRDLLNLAAERFDFVVLDGPPVIGLADAPVLASLARGTVFVVEAGSTRRGDFDGAIRRLRAANATLVGAVLSKYGRRGRPYGDSYGYDYHYSYSYGDDDQLALPKEA